VSANANAGYTCVNWTDINEVEVSTNSTYEFLLTEDTTLQANFILDAVATGPGIIDLGTAGDFVILSKSGIDRVGVTSITGNIGVSPIDQTALTGFSQIMDVTNTFSTSSYVNGKIYAADYTPPTPTYLTTAISDQETAFTTANGLTTNVIVALGAGDISGMTLAPGLYKWDTGLLITNEGVTLSGGPDDTWVFQISDDFTINNDAIITLAGGAQAKNIFWVTSTQALLGSNVQFKGNILAQTLISVNTGTSVIGKLLSQTAVTLNAATVVDQN
ncbi:MAG: ice-binding family protein, partial [Lutibacter sp.]|nr:ice-binding family protein [Lutibacter sp.]